MADRSPKCPSFRTRVTINRNYSAASASSTSPRWPYPVPTSTSGILRTGIGDNRVWLQYYRVNLILPPQIKRVHPKLEKRRNLT